MRTLLYVNLFGGEENEIKDDKKSLRQCAKLQDLGEGDYYCCDCHGGETKVKSYFAGFAQNTC